MSRAPYHLVLVALAACSADPGSTKPVSADPMDAVRTRCNKYAGNGAKCTSDPSCVEGPPRKSCSGPVCTQGGPSTCLSCRDWVAQTARVTSEYCDLRSAGREREACLLLHKNHPERCN